MRVPPNVEPGGAFGSIEETDITARLVTLIVAAALTPGGLVIDDVHPLTPLAAAARAGDLQEIDRLVSAGAEVNAGSGENDWPPLLHAIHRDQMAAVARLLAHGATIEGQSGVEAVKMARINKTVILRSRMDQGATRA